MTRLRIGMIELSGIKEVQKWTSPVLRITIHYHNARKVSLYHKHRDAYDQDLQTIMDAK